MDRYSQKYKLERGKMKLVAAGEFKNARKLDLGLRIMALGEAKSARGGKIRMEVPTFLPSGVAQKAAFTRQRADYLKVIAAGVPDWFRPGYRADLRAASWRRLSKPFQVHISRAHARGELSTYLPSKSYLAGEARFSDFYKNQAPGSDEAQALQDARDRFSEEVLVPGPDGNLVPVPDPELEQTAEDAAVEIIDMAQGILAEDQDEAEIMQTLEEEGSGMTAAEDDTYSDRTKFLLAAGGLALVLYLMRGK